MFGDIDGLGHINNKVLADWFELARNDVFRIFCPEMDPAGDKWTLILAHTDYDFVGELFFPHEAEIRSWIEKIGNSSVTIYHEAWQRGNLCTTGRCVLVNYDFNTKKSVPIPGEVRAELEKHLKN
jgi:acyl-CoA thioester hydrolase